jgi:hypothetical protein
MSCSNRHANHNQNATRNNTMGGNPNNNHRTIWPRSSGWPEIVPRRLRKGNPNNQGQQQWTGYGGNAMPQQFGGNAMPMNQQQFGMPSGQTTMQQPGMQQQQYNQQQFGGSMQQQQGPPPGFAPMWNNGQQRFF